MVKSVLILSFVCLLLTMLVGACDILDPSPEATVTRPAPTDSTEVPTGEALYVRECAFCHGLDGEPVGATITPLSQYSGTFQDFDEVLLEGPGGMPRFPYTQLDTTERHEIYDYIQKFK